MTIPAITTTAFTIQQITSPQPSPRPPLIRPSGTTAYPLKLDHLAFRSSQKNNPASTLESTTALWTSSIAYHCKNGRLYKAILQFSRMRLSGIEPNHITFVTILSGCARSAHQGVLIGPSIHGYALKLGFDVNNVMVGTAVIDMYSKFGEMGLARLSFDHLDIRNKVSWNTLINGYMRNGDFEAGIQLFDEMPGRDAVFWTVLIDGFVKKGMFEEALVWFQEIQLYGVEPDFVTIVSLLSAVANMGTLGLGLWLHRFVLNRK